MRISPPEVPEFDPTTAIRNIKIAIPPIRDALRSLASKQLYDVEDFYTLPPPKQLQASLLAVSVVPSITTFLVTRLTEAFPAAALDVCEEEGGLAYAYDDTEYEGPYQAEYEVAGNRHVREEAESAVKALIGALDLWTRLSLACRAAGVEEPRGRNFKEQYEASEGLRKIAESLGYSTYDDLHRAIAPA